jgi:Cys-tRNA synthase (O-phospho-L-seryl-tRNA:Cys-tRNA synthase)
MKPYETFQEMYESLHRDGVKPRDVTLVVHTTPELHARIAELAEREGLFLDDVVNRALFNAVTASYTQKRSAEIFAALAMQDYPLAAQELRERDK